MNPSGIPLELFPAICDKLPHMLWLARPDGFVTFLNEYGRKFLGVTLEQMEGWSWMHVVHPADQESTMHAWIEATTLRQSIEIRYRLLAADGRFHLTLVRACPITGPDGTVLLYAGTATDVEDVKQGQRDLSSANREIETLMALLNIYESKSPIGFGFLDCSLRFIRVNDTLAKMNGRSAADHVGRTVHEILPKLWSSVQPLLHSVMTTGDPIVDMESMGETPASPGVLRHWRSSYYRVSLADETLGVAAIVVDTTEEKRLQATLNDLGPEVQGRCIFPRDTASAA